jgi:signal transduction histidine kinase
MATGTGVVAATQAQPVLLDGNTPARQIGSAVYSSADVDGSMDAEKIFVRYRDGTLEKRDQAVIDFGYSKTVQWVVIPLQNTTPVDATYLLSANWPFINGLEAMLFVPGRDPVLILNKQQDAPYTDNLYSGIALISEQFLVPASSSAVIVTKFTPFAFGILPLSLETPASAHERAVLDTVGFTAFYSAVLAAAFIFMLFVIAIRHAGGIYFLGIILSGLLIITQLDGFFFAHVWPQWPKWDRHAPFVMLCFVNFTSFALASYMFRSAKLSRLARLTRDLTLASLIPFVCLAIIDVLWLIIVSYAFLIAAMAALLYAIIVWTQLLPRKRQIAFALGIGMLAVVAAIVWLVIAGFEEVNIASHNLIKLLYVFMILSSMIAYATHIAALNRNYATSLKRQLELARNEAKMNADLLTSERKFAEAQELVARHKHRLATTSHDLKQPIASLRLTLDAMAKAGGKEVESNVARAFDYLEDLVNENLQEDRQDFGEDNVDQTETIELDLLFETIVQMFGEEAISKGIRLESETSGLAISTEIVPFMRIVSNLVSNSVKHTLTGKVNLNAQTDDSHIFVDVTDTGPGMTAEEIERFSALHEKGEASDGNGLGLPICFELAERLGMELTITSQKGEGTIFRITIPRVPKGKD